MEVEVEEIEILEHDLKRSMVNHEFMIMYGNDPSGVCSTLWFYGHNCETGEIIFTNPVVACILKIC